MVSRAPSVVCNWHRAEMSAVLPPMSKQMVNASLSSALTLRKLATALASVILWKSFSSTILTGLKENGLVSSSFSKATSFLLFSSNGLFSELLRNALFVNDCCEELELLFRKLLPPKKLPTPEVPPLRNELLLPILLLPLPLSPLVCKLYPNVDTLSW